LQLATVGIGKRSEELRQLHLQAAIQFAATLIWLASTEAAPINGQTIVIDGGGIQA